MNVQVFGSILLIVILIAFNAFFAGSEIAIISLKKTRIQQLQEAGNKRADILKRLTDEPSRFLATIQVGVTLAGFLASASAASNIADSVAGIIERLGVPFLVSASNGIAIVVVTIMVSFFTLVFGELVPKRMALQKSEDIALKVARPIQLLAKLTAPFIRFLTWLTNRLVTLLGGDPHTSGSKVTEEEIRMMIDVGQEEGVFEQTETDMINSIFEFDDTVVREVMTPRVDIISISANAKLDEIIDTVASVKYSRIPVYQDSIDDIVGILYVKDLLGLLKDRDEDFSLGNMMRDPYFVPENKKIDHLFKELQQIKVHMAIVVDEYGGTAGLVTIEDLIEEIVGNIQDEYDEEEVDFEIINPDIMKVNGMITIDEVNELFDVELPEDEWETIGGFVMGLAGKVPVSGQQIRYGDLVFSIEKMDDRRVTKLKIIRDNRLKDSQGPAENSE
jgi:putative hemolysin